MAINATIANRTINISPTLLTDAIVEGDANSQTFTFFMSKFFDGVNLSEKTIKVGYYNALGESSTDNATLNNIEVDSFTFNWNLSSNVSIKGGTVYIWIEFSDLNSPYKWKTKAKTFTVESSFTVLNNTTEPDITAQLSFLSSYDNSSVSSASDTSEPVYIVGRRILIPTMDDFVVLGDNRSQIISFSMDRFYNNIDRSTKTFAIKFWNAKNETDRSSIVNVIVEDDVITFGWLIDNKVTTKDGYVKFAIEILGYEDGEFYSWSTRIAQFEVEQGLVVDGLITPPDPSWIQSWELEKTTVVNTVINKLPYIGGNLNWFVWDIASNDYIDTGKTSQGSGSGGSNGYYTFTIENGDLLLNYSDAENPPNMQINVNGDLIVTI